MKEVIEPKSGKIHRLYTHRGKPCKRIVLDSPMARQLAGYVLLEKDLRSVSVWLSEIERMRGVDATRRPGEFKQALDRERYNIIKGLFVAAITFYGKAFSQCEGRKVKLERRQIGVEFLEIHDMCIELRNNFAAHSGAKLIERAVVALVLPPKAKSHELPRIMREMDQPDVYSKSPGKKSIADLVEHVRVTPLRKIGELQDKILKEEVLPKGYTHWAKA